MSNLARVQDIDAAFGRGEQTSVIHHSSTVIRRMSPSQSFTNGG